MNRTQLLDTLASQPETIRFEQVMETIRQHYDYTPTRFTNGIAPDVVINEAGQNEGSCRIFAFAKLCNLDVEQTLACFGQYYREDVLQHPDATDHANIRTFMRHGWADIHFDAMPLSSRD